MDTGRVLKVFGHMKTMDDKRLNIKLLSLSILLLLNNNNNNNNNIIIIIIITIIILKRINERILKRF